MNNCFETCQEPSCNAGAPCKKLKRRVRAGAPAPLNTPTDPNHWPDTGSRLDDEEDQSTPPDRAWYRVVFGWAVLMVALFGTAGWVAMESGVYPWPPCSPQPRKAVRDDRA